MSEDDSNALQAGLGQGRGRHVRIKGIAHFDAISLLCNLTNPVDSVKSANEKTGASAAGAADEKPSGGNALVATIASFTSELGGPLTERTAPELKRAKSIDDSPSFSRHDSKRNSGPCEPFLASSCTGVLLESPVQHQLLPNDDRERENGCNIGVTRCKVASASEQHRLEHVDLGAYYYRQHFYEVEHQNFFGVDELLGPVAVSLKRDFIAAESGPLSPTTLAGGKSSFIYEDSMSSQSGNEDVHPLYRLIVRTARLEPLRIAVLEDSMVDPRSRVANSTSSTSSLGFVTTTTALPPRDVIAYAVPSLSLGCLRTARADQKVYDSLVRLDEQNITSQIKAGIMYCDAGQATEEEMYNNVDGSDLFKSFLNCLGDTVELKGFSKYRAQLDNKNDTTGTHSIYTTFRGNEIMFHVSTMLPHMDGKKQQLLRKRHIGNDILTIIFQEDGAEPFSPKVIRSHFQHVFIIVRHVPQFETATSGPMFQIAVTHSSSVPLTPPAVPQNPIFSLGKELHDFVLTKLVNMENTAHRSAKFLTMAMRTRHEWLMDLVENYSTSHQLDPPNSPHSWGRLFKPRGKKSVISSTRSVALSENRLRGGVSWPVKVHFWGKDAIADAGEYIFCISSRFLCVVCEKSQRLFLFVNVDRVIGWTVVHEKGSMCVYYDSGECLHFTVIPEEDGQCPEVQEIASRLSQFSDGSLCQELVLERSTNNHLGFILLAGGIVGEVDPYGVAWKSGIRQNARVLEINGKPLCGKLIKDVISQLREKSVTLLLVPPMVGGPARSSSPTRVGKLANVRSSRSASARAVPTGRPMASSTVSDPHYFESSSSKLTSSTPTSTAASPMATTGDVLSGQHIAKQPLSPTTSAPVPQSPMSSESQVQDEFLARSQNWNGGTSPTSAADILTGDSFIPPGRTRMHLAQTNSNAGEAQSPMFKGIVAKAKASLAASVAARSLPSRPDQQRGRRPDMLASQSPHYSSLNAPVGFRPRASSAASMLPPYSPSPTPLRSSSHSPTRPLSTSGRLSNGDTARSVQSEPVSEESVDVAEAEFGDASSLEVPDDASPEELRQTLVRAQSQLLRCHHKLAALRKENSNLVKVVEKLRAEQASTTSSRR